MSEPALETRELVGPYRLIRAIGAGGSARIDLARIDRAYGFQRHVVVKRPLEHLRGDAGVAASLRREAKIGGRLRHPNLVGVLDAGTHDGYDYLVLEYVHGASLRTLMQTEIAGLVREVPLPVALGIVIDIARALHDAHELTDDDDAPLGLVHRDVSPNNVLLALDGTVKLADFGIAKETRVATLSGSMHGTVTYMAPEQCRGHAFDRRADVFSLGVILYELVTQRRLFWADNDVASLHRVLSGQVEPPRRVKPSLSPALEAIVMTAVAPVPELRFATMRQLADALEALAASEAHVLGARRVAQTMEELVGPAHNPWIGATTIVDVPRKGEGSLVEVIEAVESDVESVFPTFGPAHDRGREEGVVPSAPAMPTPVARSSPRSRRLAILAAAVLVGAAAAVALTFGLPERGSDKPTPAVAPVPTAPQPTLDPTADHTAAPPPERVPHDPAPHDPAPHDPAPHDPAPHADPAALTADPSQASEVVRHVAPVPTKGAKKPRHPKKLPVPVATNPPVTDATKTLPPVLPDPPTGQPPAGDRRSDGSAAAADDVIWRRQMLMPTDSGSGKPK